MEEVSATVSSEKSNAFKAVAFGGLIAGILDLTAACVTNYWISPVRIFQSISAGLLGAESAKGGAATAILGIFLHFVIAFTATTVFYIASRKIKFLINQTVVSGVFYGVAVYWFMQLVVLPLSAFPYKKQLIPEPNQFFVGMIVHILCVGLPIALVVRHFSKSER
ncbi:MAG: hypothetical protein WA584_16560 [Pyrinomonadaceae bacterium]